MSDEVLSPAATCAVVPFEEPPKDYSPIELFKSAGVLAINPTLDDAAIGWGEDGCDEIFGV